MFSFQNLNHSWLLILIPLYVGVVLGTYYLYQKKLYKYFSLKRTHELIQNRSIIKFFFKKIIILIAIALLIIALMGPSWGQLETVEISEANDVNILVDVSTSMLVEDIKPNRLEKVKLKIHKIIEFQKGNRVGISIFAGSAFVYTPLTTDYASLHTFVNNITTSMVSRQGTDLTLGLQTSLRAFMDNENGKILIVFTDGENHNQNYQEVVNEFKRKNITVFMIGVGTANGEKIPLRDEENQITGFLKDPSGNFVISKIDFTTLSDITRKTGGVYFPLTAEQDDILTLIDYINNVNSHQRSESITTTKKNQFQSFVLAAFALLLLELFITTRSRKRNSLKNP